MVLSLCSLISQTNENQSENQSGSNEVIVVDESPLPQKKGKGLR